MFGFRPKAEVSNQGFLHRPTHASSGWPVTRTNCEEERDPRPDVAIQIDLLSPGCLLVSQEILRSGC